MNRLSFLGPLSPFVLLVPLAALSVGCSPNSAPSAGAAPSAAPLASVEVPIEARSGSKLSGTATFSTVDGGVRVVVAVAHATPGKIATHVHQKGDCSAPDGKSAGDHWNPTGHKHGLPESEHHMGDLGNIDVDADGNGKREMVITGANLTPGDKDSLLGKAIIVHEKVDDGGQPSGNAGARIGCGVIQKK